MCTFLSEFIRVPLTLLLVAGVASACADRTDGSNVFPDGRDSAGVRIVTNGSPQRIPQWVVGPDPIVVIGGAEEHGGHPLHRVSSATRYSSGDIAVADGGAAEVFVYDRNGVFQFSVGRRGSGPGEFNGRGSVSVLPSVDAIVVEQGFMPRKLVRFSLDGDYISERQSEHSEARLRGAWWPSATAPSGAAFAIAELEMEDVQSATVTRRVARLMRYTMNSERLDTIAEYPGSTFFYADVGPRPSLGGGSVAGARSIEPLFSPAAAASGGGDPFRVAAGDQSQARIDVFDESGSLRQRIEWTVEPRAPSRTDVKLAQEAYTGRWGQRDPAGTARSLAIMPEARATPIFKVIRIDRIGMVWVQRYPLPTEQLSEWWVFDTEGLLTAKVNLPSSAWPLEIGHEYILVRAADDLDVQRVEMWPLVRSANPNSGT